jgi:hypothetical protein
MLKTFWLKLSLFALPFVLLLGFPVFVLSVSGELLPISAVLALNNNSPDFRYGLAYSNADKYYKISEVRRRKPAVLALGTSRIMQLRSEFFSQPQQFYNAGGGLTRLEQFRVFLEQAGYAPSLLIVSLDQNFFNDNWKAEKYEDYPARLTADERAGLGTILMGWRGLYRDYRSGKFRLADFRAVPQCLGVSACAQRKGFRADGSYDYGIKLSEDLEERLAEAFERIGTRTEMFEKGEQVSPTRLAELQRLLAYCRAQNIHVVGFLPPYAHAVYSKMQTLSDYRYLSQIAEQVKPAFDQFQFTFADYSDLAWLGASDEEALDGFHGDERAYRRILLRLAEQNERLAQYVAKPVPQLASQH